MICPGRLGLTSQTFEERLIPNPASRRESRLTTLTIPQFLAFPQVYPAAGIKFSKRLRRLFFKYDLKFNRYYYLLLKYMNMFTLIIENTYFSLNTYV
jgi:hypothetical protein